MPMMASSAPPLIAEFNATVETTLFGLPRVNVQFELTNETIARRHIVGRAGDRLFFDMSSCANPDRHFWAIAHYSAVSVLCLLSFAFQLTLFVPFFKLAKTNGPAFYLLLMLLLCSTVSIIMFQLVLHLEAAIGHRFPIPFDMDYYVRMPFGRGEAVFYFIYSANRCACLFFPMQYSSMFSKRRIVWMIFWAWVYCLLENSERLLANKGMNRVHCLGLLDDGKQTYLVIKDPVMIVIEAISIGLTNIIWCGPALLDVITLAKLFREKYEIRSKSPWVVERPVMAARIAEGRSERIRLFLICFFISFYHFLFTLIFGYDILRPTNLREPLPQTYYNLSYILENAMPYALMLAISRDVRLAWCKCYCPCLLTNFRLHPRILPLSSTHITPNNNVIN